MKVRLFIEGGGDSPLQDAQFRQGWAKFFEKAGLRGRLPKVFRGGGRGATFDAFVTSVKQPRANELPLLLVDSEDLPNPGDTPWKHLEKRPADQWKRPSGAGADDAFLMVTCMETWFVADRISLSRFFGYEWRESALPAWQNLEQVPKTNIQAALSQASAQCGPRSYQKGKLSFDLLGEIDPKVVAAACPSAARLLNRLLT